MRSAQMGKLALADQVLEGVAVAASHGCVECRLLGVARQAKGACRSLAWVCGIQEPASVDSSRNTRVAASHRYVECKQPVRCMNCS